MSCSCPVWFCHSFLQLTTRQIEMSLFLLDRIGKRKSEKPDCSESDQLNSTEKARSFHRGLAHLHSVPLHNPFLIWLNWISKPLAAPEQSADSGRIPCELKSDKTAFSISGQNHRFLDASSWYRFAILHDNQQFHVTARFPYSPPSDRQITLFMSWRIHYRAAGPFPLPAPIVACHRGRQPVDY